MLAQIPAQARTEVARWRDEDWPLTVRRQEADCASDQLCVGIALPPQNGDKIRLPLRVAQNTVSRFCPPLFLSRIVPALPPHWRDAVMRLHEAAQLAGISVQVFGSAALQSLTGLTYLHAASDLDLLLQPSTPKQLEVCQRLFRAFETQLPLDGEIIFGAAAAVAIREWCNAAHQAGAFRVLVKQATGVALMRKEVLMPLLDCPICMPI